VTSAKSLEATVAADRALVEQQVRGVDRARCERPRKRGQREHAALLSGRELCERVLSGGKILPIELHLGQQLQGLSALMRPPDRGGLERPAQQLLRAVERSVAPLQAGSENL